jgi:hypothetical protein
MLTHDIRNLIREASEMEAQTLFLYSELEAFYRKKTMNSKQKELGDTYEFAFNYIRHVPELLEMIDQRAAKHGVRVHIHNIIMAVGENFTSGYHPVGERFGLLALLDKAYLVHTTLQSISDNYQILTGKVLLPTTMKIANNLVRKLIGDKVGSILDEIARVILRSPVVQKNFDLILTNYNTFNITGPDPVWGFNSVNEIAGLRLVAMENV